MLRFLRLYEVIYLKNQIRVGLDIGSTTLKAVVLGEYDELLYEKYERHFSQIAEKATEMLYDIQSVVGDTKVLFAISAEKKLPP